MGIFLSFGVRLACLAALGISWGWLWGVGLLVGLVFIKPKRGFWGDADFSSAMSWLRVGLEVFVTVAGLFAANAIWGGPWAAAMLVIYAISFVVK